jgi:acyl-CoA thioesterase-1
MRKLRNLTGVVIFSAGVVQADPVTIAALGDSLTAGYGLQQSEGFVPQMQAWLDTQGADITLINAGVSGDTTAGGLSRVDWTLGPDVDAVIVALGGNDYLRGIDPKASEANLDGILKAADAAGVAVLLVGLPAGNNYGPDYKAQFDGMFPALAEKYHVPLYSSWFAGLMAEAGTQEGVPQFMQADGLHPNAEGVRLIVAAMGPAVEDLALRAVQ